MNYLKRVQGLLVLLMLAFAAPMLTACGSDDDEPEASHPIVDVWKVVNIEFYNEATGTYSHNLYDSWYEKYAQDGTFEWGFSLKMTDVQGRGTWKITGNKLTIKYKSIPDGTSHEKDYTSTFAGNQLVLIATKDKWRYTYERIP